MLGARNHEDHISQNEKKINELSLQIEALDRKVEELLNEFKIDCEAILKFNENKDNFSDEEWEELQHERDQLRLRLLKELQGIKNPTETEKKYKERNVQPHWLFIR